MLLSNIPLNDSFHIVFKFLLWANCFRLNLNSLISIGSFFFFLFFLLVGQIVSHNFFDFRARLGLRKRRSIIYCLEAASSHFCTSVTVYLLSLKPLGFFEVWKKKKRNLTPTKDRKIKLEHAYLDILPSSHLKFETSLSQSSLLQKILILLVLVYICHWHSYQLEYVNLANTCHNLLMSLQWGAKLFGKDQSMRTIIENCLATYQKNSRNKFSHTWWAL